MNDTDKGVSDKSDRAVVNGAASVSAVPASILDAAQIASLEKAARTLLDACLLADAKEDLSSDIDGEMMDALSDALDWRWPEIWTDEQVAALNASQDGYGHPFTCGGDRSDDAHKAYAREHGGDWGQLEATRRGWVCPVCDYRQTWAHTFQFEGARHPVKTRGTE